MNLFKRNSGSKTGAAQESQAPTVEPRHLTGAEFDGVTRDSTLPVV